MVSQIYAQIAMKARHAAAPRPIMTVAEVAKYSRLHPSTVYKLVHRGQIPAFKVGSDWRFDGDLIDKWMGRPTSEGVK